VLRGNAVEVLVQLQRVARQRLDWQLSLWLQGVATSKRSHRCLCMPLLACPPLHFWILLHSPTP